MSRLNIMVSSSSLDLPEHRAQVTEAIQRMGHFPLAMEFGTAMPDSDAITYSLEMVDKADVYIGIFAERYGHKPTDSRNPKNLSITELEYRNALGKKPMLHFVAHEDHLFKKAQIEKDPESQIKLELLKKEILAKEICGFFKSELDLRGLVIQAVHELKVDKVEPTGQPAKEEKIILPMPPALYAVPEYRLTNKFIGRSSELDVLDTWAQSGDTVMVVEGIGGRGKIALTWEWTTTRAEQAIPNLAGRIWWSFYERGTSMVTFVRHALAYVTGQDPEFLRKDISHFERGRQLLVELRRRPYLLILDGFERVLAAYHHLDKAQIPDSEVDTALRDCINPADGDLLNQLLGCDPSKILITTRLMPKSLQDRASNKAAKGVAQKFLKGLSSIDTLNFMRQAGIKGEASAMLLFAEQFGCHSLLLQIVCGMVANYRRKPYDFDAWNADPLHGGDLKLSDLELKQKNTRTHILHFSLRGLDEKTLKLLSRIALVSERATYDTLAVLNPFLPQQPPKAGSLESAFKHLDIDGETILRLEYPISKPVVNSAYQEALKTYYASAEYSQALKDFDEALSALEARGLVQWNRESNHYEMHPVVRALAVEILEQRERNETFDRVRDHFETLPPDDMGSATELTHVNQSIEIYRCFVGAGRLDEAVSFFSRELGPTLVFHIGAIPVAFELLSPLLDGDSRPSKAIHHPINRKYVLTEMALVLIYLRRDQEALKISIEGLKWHLEEHLWAAASNSLNHIAYILQNLDRRSESLSILHAAHLLATAGGTTYDISMAIYFKMAQATVRGEFSLAENLFKEFFSRPIPPSTLYRRGSAEYRYCLNRFYQQKMRLLEWQEGHDLAQRNRNIAIVSAFNTLRAEWELTNGQAEKALAAIDQALLITNKMGILQSSYHDLRGWALASLGRATEAKAELQDGEQRLFASEAYVLLENLDSARACALNAYRWAWGEGPPHIHWYYLERSRDLLKRLGEPEPLLPPFDSKNVAPMPFEKEISAAIRKLHRAKRVQESGPPDEPS